MAYLATSSTALAFLTNMSEKCKSTSLNAIQVNNRQKTISIEYKLDLISWIKEGGQIFDIDHNVKLAHTCMCTIHSNSAHTKEHEGKR